jgi:hypothetical protein
MLEEPLALPVEFQLANRCDQACRDFTIAHSQQLKRKKHKATNRVFSSIIDAEKLFDVVDRYYDDNKQENKQERTLSNSFRYKEHTE